MKDGLTSGTCSGSDDFGGLHSIKFITFKASGAGAGAQGAEKSRFSIELERLCFTRIQLFAKRDA